MAEKSEVLPAVEGVKKNCEGTTAALTKAQTERMKKNLDRALELKRARVELAMQKIKEGTYSRQINVASRPRDTGAGFLLDEDEDDGDLSEKRPCVNIPAPLFSEDRPICIECNEEFAKSYLHEHFDYPLCDSCRDPESEEHSLITRTDAKKEYLLKDCDLDSREPPLKFILKPNRHSYSGNMKLYLKLQVERRAFDIFGSEENLDEIKQQKVEASQKRKQKQFDKKLKALRMSVRSSLYRKKDVSHKHDYGPELYDEDTDIYETICSICGHHKQYEKMKGRGSSA